MTRTACLCLMVSSGAAVHPQPGSSGVSRVNPARSREMLWTTNISAAMAFPVLPSGGHTALHERGLAPPVHRFVQPGGMPVAHTVCYNDAPTSMHTAGLLTGDVVPPRSATIGASPQAAPFRMQSNWHPRAAMELAFTPAVNSTPSPWSFHASQGLAPNFLGQWQPPPSLQPWQHQELFGPPFSWHPHMAYQPDMFLRPPFLSLAQAPSAPEAMAALSSSPPLSCPPQWPGSFEFPCQQAPNPFAQQPDPPPGVPRQTKGPDSGRGALRSPTASFQAAPGAQLPREKSVTSCSGAPTDPLKCGEKFACVTTEAPNHVPIPVNVPAEAAPGQLACPIASGSAASPPAPSSPKRVVLGARSTDNFEVVGWCEVSSGATVASNAPKTPMATVIRPHPRRPDWRDVQDQCQAESTVAAIIKNFVVSSRLDSSKFSPRTLADQNPKFRIETRIQHFRHEDPEANFDEVGGTRSWAFVSIPGSKQLRDYVKYQQEYQETPADDGTCQVEFGTNVDLRGTSQLPSQLLGSLTAVVVLYYLRIPPSTCRLTCKHMCRRSTVVTTAANFET